MAPVGPGWFYNASVPVTTQRVNNRHNGVAFDQAGNQTEVPVGATSNTADYDGENRLVRVRNSSNATLESYDGEGRRIRKTVGAAVTYYVYECRRSTVGRGGRGRTPPQMCEA